MTLHLVGGFVIMTFHLAVLFVISCLIGLSLVKAFEGRIDE